LYKQHAEKAKTKTWSNTEIMVHNEALSNINIVKQHQQLPSNQQLPSHQQMPSNKQMPSNSPDCPLTPVTRGLAMLDARSASSPPSGASRCLSLMAGNRSCTNNSQRAFVAQA
jgi:hypothetical protein